MQADGGALSRWLDELDERYGAPSAGQFARADRVVDEALGLLPGRTSAGAA